MFWLPPAGLGSLLKRPKRRELVAASEDATSWVPGSREKRSLPSCHSILIIIRVMLGGEVSSFVSFTKSKMFRQRHETEV